MGSGLLELFRAVDDADVIREYLDNASFDEVYKFNPEKDFFSVLCRVPQKYAMQLDGGTFGELYAHLLEQTVYPDEQSTMTSFLDKSTLRARTESSAVPGVLCAEFRFRLFGGGYRWVELMLVTGERFGITDNAYRMYVFDVHSRKMRELGLQAHSISGANRHAATGLLRQEAFETRCEDVLGDRKVAWCIVSIDIENFKRYNEWYGQPAGDRIMEQLGALLLQTKLECGGLAGYFGQDDFCMLMPHDENKIRALYMQIYARLNENDSAAVFMPAFGVCPADENITVHEMLERAALAARFAKGAYHRRIRTFNSSMLLQTDEEYHIMNEFMQAMKNGEIVFFLHPQCRASTGRIVGAEALARWVKPDGFVVPPADFISVLEKYGMITDLDEYIWEQVCAWQKKCIDRGRTPLPISVNVSPLDIPEVRLAQHFEALTQKYGLAKDLIKIEITESAYISNASLVIETVKNLREAGFVVLLDDFGSGYSSLNMLRTLNVDAIKLDAQFLQMDKIDEQKGIHILESVVNMAKSIGLPIIVEGVETAAQKRFVEELGCRYVQGFFFFRPIRTEAFEALLTDPDNIDSSGIVFKPNEQFRLRELLDDNVYSDAMLNNILGPCALYSLHGNDIDIVRFNEQFYEAVDDVPGFSERLHSIQHYVFPQDLDRVYAMLRRAESDRLNGASDVIRFINSDDSLSSFYMRVYYLRTEDNARKFYGSVQNITKLTALERKTIDN